MQQVTASTERTDVRRGRYSASLLGTIKSHLEGLQGYEVKDAGNRRSASRCLVEHQVDTREGPPSAFDAAWCVLVATPPALAGCCSRKWRYSLRTPASFAEPGVNLNE